jgi:transaldolase
MKATRHHSLGQSIWLDNITRDLLDTGTLKRYIDELSVTGLTSNPTIFENAIKKAPLTMLLFAKARERQINENLLSWHWKTSPGGRSVQAGLRPD